MNWRERAERIAAKNDRFRRRGEGGFVAWSQGIERTGLQEEIMARIQIYTNFPLRYDPYGEHDYGRFTIGVHKVVWRFDYYTMPGFVFGADPLGRNSLRLLWVMLEGEERAGWRERGA